MGGTKASSRYALIPPPLPCPPMRQRKSVDTVYSFPGNKTSFIKFESPISQVHGINPRVSPEVGEGVIPSCLEVNTPNLIQQNAFWKGPLCCLDNESDTIPEA